MDDSIGHADSKVPQDHNQHQSAQVRQRLWFVRKDGLVTGPYPERLIASFLILGRLEPTHEISPDRETWSAIVEYPHLLHTGLLDPKDPVAREELLHERLREDERVGGRRQRESWLQSSGEKRRNERRAPESMTLRVARRLRLERVRQGQKPREMPSRGVQWALILTPLLALAALVLAAGLDRMSNSETAPPDCGAAPAPGIVWNHCDLSGLDLRMSRLDGASLRNANLRASNLNASSMRAVDLSFADLRSARLERSQLDGAVFRGANLAGASLLGANLSGADFSHADLRNAELFGANLADARLDRALWVDGRQCGEGSLGTCR